MSRGRKVALLVCAAVLLTAVTAPATPVCISISGLTYRLDIGQAGDALIVNGVRYSPIANLPITGSGFITSDGSSVIGFTEHFDYASGAWFYPQGTTILRAIGSSLTFDRTYFGALFAPLSTASGTFTIVTCPATTDLQGPGGPDPNAK